MSGSFTAVPDDLKSVLRPHINRLSPCQWRPPLLSLTAI
jgi:hypothetical protein